MNGILSEDFDIIFRHYNKDFIGLRNKKILVTGAYGLLTSYLSMFLIYISDRYDIELYIQCRNLGKARRIFADYIDNKRVHIVNFDLEKNDIPDINFDYIIHAASAASTKAFIETPVEVISPNVIGTWNLLNFAKRTGVKKLLFFSSNSIYGEGGIEKTVLSENDYGIVDPLNDRSSYIESKRMAEQMCKAFWKEYMIPSSIIRICHTYGPTFDLQSDTRIIPRVMCKILAGQDIEIYKDPNSVIQYTYIADMISASLIVLLKGECGEAYNAGGNEIVKMDDVIEWMVNADKSITSRLIEKKIDSNYNFAKGKGINFVKLSNERLCNLGWKQLFKNEEGFKRTVKSYLADFKQG